ncbi:MAG: alanine--tRNA ligase, partial [Planctomycetes bacterium]|nr:alanine--tRNA ligase [Planctomycetota bacterium]
LSVPVYRNDDEAADIWTGEIKLPASRVQRLEEDENFWPASAPSQGPDGVCGPCSEIFYHGDEGGEVEIWNLVFTQFNRVGDPPDNLRPLPSKNIDTGMGLERTAAVLQGVDTNYHIDILRPIVEAAGEVCSTKYDPGSDTGRRLRRIADHVRACTMSIHENVYPGPNKEKYVIKRLLRRAVLDGHQLGLHEPFLYKLVESVVEMMKPAYPELSETTRRVADVIRKEEENFFGTIDAGLARIEKIFDTMRGGGRTTVEGAEAADLYQTYGVPPELFEAMAAENNLAFDWDGFRRAMDEHGEASGKLTHTVMGGSGPIDAIKKVLHETEFLGYEATEAKAELKFIVAQNQLCDHLQEVGHASAVIVVLDRSPFYGESGGQVGDRGEITGETFRFQVTDTQKDGELLLHVGHLVEGEMTPGAKVTATVDTLRRDAIRRAHSATHILHYALQKNLGKHAQQQGSKVDEDWLRFDFTNPSAVPGEELAAIQADVAEQVAASEPVKWETLPLPDARAAGAMMLFGEKYPDPVRMVSMGEFSRELCGGTHLDNTAQVGAFEIIGEESVAAGTRRITALTGKRAKEHHENTRAALSTAAETLGVGLLDVPARVEQISDRLRGLKKQLGGGAMAADLPAAVKTSGEASSEAIHRALTTAARRLNVSPFDVPTRVEAMVKEVA